MAETVAVPVDLLKAWQERMEDYPHRHDTVGALLDWCASNIHPAASNETILENNHQHETVLEEAQRLVYGPRQQAYGHPADDFARTGRIWGAILAEWARTTGGDEPVPAELVGLCMIGVKLSREVNAPARDNLTDAAGYAATVAMIRERQAIVECRPCRDLGPPVARACTICGAEA